MVIEISKERMYLLGNGFNQNNPKTWLRVSYYCFIHVLQQAMQLCQILQAKNRDYNKPHAIKFHPDGFGWSTINHAL